MLTSPWFLMPMLLGVLLGYLLGLVSRGLWKNRTMLGGQDSLDTKTGHFKVETSYLNSLTLIICS